MKTTEENIKAFYEAIEKNDYNKISELIKSDKNIVNATDSYGKTPLHFAAGNACPEIASNTN